MKMGLSPSGPHAAWRELYLAAVFESDTTKQAARIAEAERAVVIRAHELFHLAGANFIEGEALDKALYCLNALRNSYGCSKAGTAPSLLPPD